MKLVTTTALIKRGGFPKSPSWRRALQDIKEAVDAVRWPPDAANFTIYPESGKRSNQGNGVRPIKIGFVTKLVDLGWRLEERYPHADADKERALRPGDFDAHLDLTSVELPPFVVEWETGNVSSSHRALNKMAMALLDGRISGGILIVPTRTLYQYLTDRVGNYREIEPYFPLWSALSIKNGYLGVIAVEHDATSNDVPRIAKGTDGRALV